MHPISIFYSYRDITTTDAANHFLDCAYYNWRMMPADERKGVTNALYMHCRVPLYEQPWERFTMEYIVFDSLYRIASVSRGFTASYHEQRIEATCQSLGLAFDQDCAARLVSLRNNLFHEAMWDGEHPGHGWSDQAYQNCQHLRRLNQKIIPALLGYSSPYVRGPWTQWQQMVLFDR